MPIQIKKPLKLKPTDYLSPIRDSMDLMASELERKATPQTIESAMNAYDATDKWATKEHTHTDWQMPVGAIYTNGGTDPKIELGYGDWKLKVSGEIIPLSGVLVSIWLRVVGVKAGG